MYIETILSLLVNGIQNCVDEFGGATILLHKTVNFEKSFIGSKRYKLKSALEYIKVVHDS